jgi:hypothetical protein
MALDAISETSDDCITDEDETIDDDTTELFLTTDDDSCTTADEISLTISLSKISLSEDNFDTISSSPLLITTTVFSALSFVDFADCCV